MTANHATHAEQRCCLCILTPRPTQAGEPARDVGHLGVPRAERRPTRRQRPSIQRFGLAETAQGGERVGEGAGDKDRLGVIRAERVLQDCQRARQRSSASARRSWRARIAARVASRPPTPGHGRGTSFGQGKRSRPSSVTPARGARLGSARLGCGAGRRQDPITLRWHSRRLLAAPGMGPSQDSPDYKSAARQAALAVGSI